MSALAAGPPPDRTTEEDRRAMRAVAVFAALAPDDRRRARARREAIEAWLPLAYRLAHRFTGRGERDEDLRQVAAVGIVQAVDRYDPGAGEFTAFAIPTVLGALRRHFRDHTWAVHVPRRVQELRMAINDAGATLTATLGRSPTVAEVAAHLRVDEEDVLDGLEGARAYAATSLSTPVRAEGDVTIGDVIPAEDHSYELAESLLDLGPALLTLDDRERELITLRFYHHLTQAQIGEQLGVSQMHISRLLSRALAKLRTRMQTT